MAICKYSGCGKEFTPNPRNRTTNKQEFCNYRCRWKHWNDSHPREGIVAKPVPPPRKRRNAETEKAS